MSAVEGRFRDKDNWIWIRKHKYIKQQPKSNNLSIRGLFILSMHTDLDGPRVSEKSKLCQNGLDINRKCLRLIARYSPSSFLSAF